MVAIAISGNSKWGPAGLSGKADLKVPETPSGVGDAGGSKFGLAISGDAAVTVLNDDTKAYVSGSDVTSDALQIAARNSLGVFQGTGTLVANSGNGLAGSFSYLQGNRSAKAWLDNATVNTRQLAINADFDDSYALGSAGLGVSTNDVTVAGSANVVNMTQKAWAWIGSKLERHDNCGTFCSTPTLETTSSPWPDRLPTESGPASVPSSIWGSSILTFSQESSPRPQGSQESLTWLPTNQNDFSAAGIIVNNGGNFAATTRYNGLLIAPVACAAAKRQAEHSRHGTIMEPQSAIPFSDRQRSDDRQRRFHGEPGVGGLRRPGGRAGFRECRPEFGGRHRCVRRRVQS